jgi:hypothetical protein
MNEELTNRNDQSGPPQIAADSKPEFDRPPINAVSGRSDENARPSLEARKAATGLPLLLLSDADLGRYVETHASAGTR